MPFTGPTSGLVVEVGREDKLNRREKEHIPVPLIGVEINTKVVNFLAKVEVRQNYVNKEKKRIEAIYLFPVEEEAAVIEFTAQLEGKTIKTIVKEKEEAFNEFTKAVSTRQIDFLLEETKPDIFLIKVGHLSPGACCQVTITYLTELPIEEGKTRITIPTTVVPRYIPPSDDSEEAKKIATIEYDFTSPTKMTMQMVTLMKTEIENISSPSHEIVNVMMVTKNREGYFVTNTSFEGETTDMDRDIVLLIESVEPNEPAVVLEKNDQSVVAMLSFVPSFQLKENTAEIVFLIDCSHSMHTKSIDFAKEALQLLLHSLPVDCYFNIFKFGREFFSLFPNSVKYDDTSLAVGKKLASNITANLGGTNILSVLDHILKQKQIPGYPRKLFFLTEGQVSNTHDCIRCVKRYNNTARVFTLGVGAGANRHLVKGVARVGQGTAMFANYGEKLAPKVLKQLKDSLLPSISNIKINWGDAEDHKEDKQDNEPIFETSFCIGLQAPARTPPVYVGSRLLVYKMFREDEVQESVKITADTPDGPLSLEVAVDRTNIPAGNSFHQMFARKKIQDLEEGEEDEEEGIRKMIVHLGTKYNLASEYTSFVGVEGQQEMKTGQIMMTRYVKNQLARNFHLRKYGCLCSIKKKTSLAGAITINNKKPMHYDCTDGPGNYKKADPSFDRTTKKLVQLTSLQVASGEFKMAQIVEEMFGHSLDDIQPMAKNQNVPLSVWITAVVVAVLEKLFDDDEECWQMIVDKARKWISKEGHNHPALVQQAKFYIIPRLKMHYRDFV